MQSKGEIINYENKVSYTSFLSNCIHISLTIFNLCILKSACYKYAIKIAHSFDLQEKYYTNSNMIRLVQYYRMTVGKQAQKAPRS